MIKIIDLGIAKSEDRMTSNRNTLIGTIPYMAPEQLLGKSATQKSDIFSAGLTLVELFTKNHPFISLENLRSIDKAIIEQAQSGALPAAPDFSKPTHARFRAKLAKLVALAEAGDLEGLKAVEINPVSTSPKAMARYCDLAIIAIEARRKAA